MAAKASIEKEVRDDENYRKDVITTLAGRVAGPAILDGYMARGQTMEGKSGTLAIPDAEATSRVSDFVAAATPVSFAVGNVPSSISQGELAEAADVAVLAVSSKTARSSSSSTANVASSLACRRPISCVRRIGITRNAVRKEASNVPGFPTCGHVGYVETFYENFVSSSNRRRSFIQPWYYIATTF